MTTATEILTTTLNSGIMVLAKNTKWGITARTYANRTQAEAAAARTKLAGVDCFVIQTGRPFYVRIAE